MTDIYVFADETGDLGYNFSGPSPYFGFGTATFDSSSINSIANSFEIRCILESQGHILRDGFHARNDKHAIRMAVFEEITKTKPIFDFTFLNKKNVYDHVRKQGDLRLYKLAWYLHFKYIASQYIGGETRIFAICADIQTRAKKSQIRHALEDVAVQMQPIEVIPIIWDSKTSWGLQVADYGLWEAQRKVLNNSCDFWESSIKDNLRSLFFPWGKEEIPAIS